MRKFHLCFFVLILCACSKQSGNQTRHFPEGVVSYPSVNSVYDDYNSNIDTFGDQYLLQFSSNRNSAGKEFDIVGFASGYSWNNEKDEFYIDARSSYEYSFKELTGLYDSINTPANELGPYSRQLFIDNAYKYLTLYATDQSGNFDIKFSYPENVNSNQVPNERIPARAPQGISYINTSANELYPSLYSEDLNSAEPTFKKLFYCSDKSGNFDMYEVDFGEGGKILSLLTSKALYESKALALNSGGDDKCPYFYDNVLIFASNRPGGYGGFDLYYSLYEDGAFTEPVNFGDMINTEADEYRPILLSHRTFNNHLMVFSSNRSGGKGGFDLYYTGVQIERK